ncbi:hypothetical protein J4760_05150 [Salinicoccus sp. ID82-1]|uniref:Antibiotic biosynthesis monooxygenase n=1 Tax=Salinicoccus cyprini TaxID=2493691 RepID=A0A558AZX7_9STAP|nr:MULTISPECIES: hypothetical protein [Salinicoccus]MCG1009432.1 hypothetical protein [Salinicoccus sp. ID82-1]TVT29803.1 hypothetical protein FO441_05900 [Salinicoccus cyprini]
MKLHLTTGTITYMQSLARKHSGVSIAAMGQDAVLYYESDSNDSIFSSRQSYDLINSSGPLEDSPTSIHYIPIPGENKDPMYSHLAEVNDILSDTNGVLAYRIGEALAGDGFIVFIQWAKTSTYNDFKQTNSYRNYLTAEALSKYRTAEALFHKSISARLYLPLKDNEADPEDEF